MNDAALSDAATGDAAMLTDGGENGDAGEAFAGVLCAGMLCGDGTPVCCDPYGTASCVADVASCGGQPLVCDGREDCEGGAYCVVGALGGLGCETSPCCGDSECTNGCHVAADCPECRPSCVDASPTAFGHCSE